MRRMNFQTILSKTAGLLVAPCLLLSGCFEFDAVTQVEDFRVLGVRAEPPEIRPGEGTTLQVLWADPKGKDREVSFAWMGCSGTIHPSEGIATCDMLVPPVVGTAEAGGDILEIPVTPTDMLDGVPEGGYLRATFIVLMCAGGTLPAPERYAKLRETTNVNDLCRKGDGLSAFKTVMVSDSDTPQTNPVIDRVYFEGMEMTPADEGGGGKLRCKEGGECEAEIALFVTEESVQTYDVIEFGKPTPKQDEVFLSWYVTGGDFDKSRSGDTCEKKGMEADNPCISETDEDPSGPFEVSWIPEKPGTFTLWAVAHDLRGGVGWQAFTVEAVQ